MNRASELTLFVDDLAGHWTEPALELLKAAGIRAISVDMEVEAWRTLRRILYSELRWHRAFQPVTLVFLSTVMEQVLRKATLVLAYKFAPNLVSHAVESQIRRLAAERRSTEAERRLYAAVVHQLGLRASFKPSSRTVFTPRLRVSAVGG